MDKNLKLQYFERLITPNGLDTYFIEQYLKGSGKELAEKFWSVKSSSRLCFDLYSWLCKVDDVKNFQFEKQLPGVKTGVNRVSGVPNMDVFFEINDNLVFIESKYTETGDNWKYMEDAKKDGYCLSEAYWGTNEGGYKSCKLTIGERFYNHPEIAESFSNFCKVIQNEINTRKPLEYAKFSWFDPKQETCHLFGIIFYVLENNVRNRNVYLCNNVFRCENSGDCFDISGSIIEVFKNKAEEMLNKIFVRNKCKFFFEVNAIQDILSNGYFGQNFTNAKMFGMEDKNVASFITENYLLNKR